MNTFERSQEDRSLNGRETFPLTAGQLGIWFIQMMDRADASCSIGECVEIRGRLDEEQFERSLRLVVAVSDAMHVRLAETDAGPVQYFEHDPDWPLIRLDFRNVVDGEQAARAWMSEDMGRPFRLGADVLFRYALLRISDERYFWYAVNHHIINDGIGWRLLKRRVADAYSALVQGAPAAHPARPSWREFLSEDIAYRQSDQFERDRRYWLDQLASRPPPVTLSGREPERPVGFAKTTARLPHSLDLEVIARRFGTRPAAVIVAATAIYLHRVIGATDILIGMPLAARVGPVARSVVGIAANALPLRIEVSAVDTVGAVIDRSARSMKGALRHQRYRGEDLRRDLDIPPAASDIYGTYVNFTPFEEGITFDGHAASSDPLGNWGVEDLQFVYYGGSDPLGQRLDVIGNPKHYTAGELAEHACRFIGIVEQIAAAAPSAPVAEFAILTPTERHTIIDAWNDTAKAIPSATLSELFSKQVRTHGSETALVSGHHTWSYSELDVQANRIAHALLARDIGSGSRVALAAPRSLPMVAALLGILKADAAYVPIDPDYPAARLEMMLADCEPALVIVTEATEHVAGFSSAPTLILDRESFVRELESYGSKEEPKPRKQDWNDPAYVIYTSGSSGEPKGVVGLNKGMVNRLLWMDHVLPYRDAGPTLAKTSLSFVDGSTELLGPLLCGGTVVLAEHEAARDPAALAGLIATHSIGRMTVVPSLLSAILDVADPVQLVSCRLWITSGAKLPKSLSARFHDLLPGARLVNLYGTSEASGDSLYAVCSANDCPIGRPIWNTRVYVLNERLEPVPAGAIGELYLAGVGLAAGYLHRSALTAERFLPNPFAEDGSLMYRTGDLVRWRADGAIEFRSRADDQVKINGVRIELGEVERALNAAAGVGDAAVVARQIDDTASQLVAFVVASGCEPPTERGLRTHLRALLPEHAMPVLYRVLDDMPVLPNGKRDRLALLKQAGEIAGSSPASTSPLRTPTEITLAEIWSEVLRHPVLERKADFFASGGDSLRAVQVATRVRRLFAIDLPLTVAFQARTLEALAERIDQMRAESSAVRPLPALHRAIDGITPSLSYSQQRMWTVQSLDPNNTAYNMSAAVRLRGAIEVRALSQAIDSLLLRHEILRSTYRIVDGQVAHRVEPFKPNALEIIDLTATEAEPQQAAIARANACVGKPIDLETGPVFSSSLMRIGDDDHILHLVAHHIACDQWSMGIIGREITAHYNSLRVGETPELQPPRLSYSDFAVWEREHLGGNEIAQQLDYWRVKLANMPPLDLPTDKPRPRLQSFEGSHVLTEVPDELFIELRQLARRESATLLMTMLAAYAALLSRLSDQRDIAIGMPVANRLHDDVEQMVGTFVNLLVLRIDLSGDPPFSEIVARAQAVALEAFANQSVPFERLVQELMVSRDTSRAPLAQVMFNGFNTPMHGLDFEGLDWEPIELHRRGAQFELSVSIDPQITKTVTFEYSTELFEKATIERLIASYLKVLSQVVTAPQTRLSELDILGEQERRLVLETWNATETMPPPELFITQFEERAAGRPDAPAVTFGDETVTYGELDQQANALAHDLVRAGIGRGSTVGVCVERSITMVVSLLAVQKSGATYVPLDPELPAARIAYMMLDSGIRAVIVTEVTSARHELPDGIVRIVAKAGVAAVDCAAAGRVSPQVAIERSDPVYVIYTSGSTGRPKGVVVSHGALANFLASMRREPGLSEDDVLAAVTTISFDIAGLELYLPLATGARIELVAPAVASDGVKLSRLLSKRNVSVMQATPSTWRMLIDAGWAGSPKLRALCGGETLQRELAEQVLDRVGELWNLYGPTETTIWSTACRITAEDGVISIGRPIDNTQIYILQGNAPCPIGTIGEICIGGAGVAVGYLGREELTAEKFVSDPFARSSNARMYRTGDLGRWGPDGRLYHFGRMDHQIKIRGFRVEVGEIEAVLNEHPAVRQAIVATRVLAPGDVRLVVYIQYRGEQELTTSDIRRHLRSRLPDYMVPAVAVTLDRVPLSASGKVDRNALPSPFEHAVRSPSTFEEPNGGLETVIAGLWRDLLKLERVGAEDNFFELGGDSLLALRFVSAMEQATGARIEPRKLFFQNLRQVAATLAEFAGEREAASR